MCKTGVLRQYTASARRLVSILFPEDQPTLRAMETWRAAAMPKESAIIRFNTHELALVYHRGDNILWAPNALVELVASQLGMLWSSDFWQWWSHEWRCHITASGRCRSLNCRLSCHTVPKRPSYRAQEGQRDRGRETGKMVNATKLDHWVAKRSELGTWVT